jgi:signal transduction histidine kinase
VEVRSGSFRHQGRRLSISVVREVSERHKVQRRIEANERDFLTLAETAQDCISCHDRRGRPTYVNSRLKDFLRERGILAGGETLREIAKLMRDRLPPEFHRSLRQVLRTGAATCLEMAIAGSDGTSRLHQLHITPECDAAGAVLRVLVVGRDMTAWREDQQRLEATHAQLRKLAARLESAREQERRRVARELHDELGQRLIALRLGVHSLSARLGLAPGQAAPLLGQVDRTLATVRRICTSLRPPVLDFGLGPALHWLGADFTARAGIPCAVQVPDGDLDLGEARTALLFRVAQEALDNVARHARASAAQLTLAASGRGIRLEIQDDGAGFDPDAPSPPGTFGLLAIRERARSVGAEFHIDSSPRRGTRILLHLPVAPAPGR